MKQSKESKLEYVVKKVRRDIAQMHVCMAKKNAPIAWQSRLLKKSSSTAQSAQWKSAGQRWRNRNDCSDCYCNNGNWKETNRCMNDFIAEEIGQVAEIKWGDEE